MTLEENINRAAGELPYGWTMEINVELGAGWVSLYDSTGTHTGFNSSESINEQVCQAISYARERA